MLEMFFNVAQLDSRNMGTMSCRFIPYCCRRHGVRCLITGKMNTLGDDIGPLASKGEDDE